MPAHEYLHGIQFSYDNPELGESTKLHRIRASTGGSQLGEMIWGKGGGIRNIMTTPGQERRGVATAMWQEGHRLAGEQASVPRPKHSKERTNAGDAWARSVGGRLPRRSR
jgi:hypothetical protein